MNRQKLLLAVLLGVLALSLAYAFWRTPRQERVRRAEPGKTRQTTAATEGQEPVSADERLPLELLTPEMKEYRGLQRNIFAVLPEAPPAPPPPPPPPTVAPPPPPTAAVPPPPPPTRFDMLGFLEKNGETVVFLGLGKDIYLVREGESFGPRREFNVVSLNDEVLVVRREGETRSITIPLGEGSSQ